MKKTYDFKAVSRLDMHDPRLKLLNKLNAVAFVCIVVCCVTGAILNYCLRMRGTAGGMYFVYIICGFAACMIYPYIHEFAHAFAIMAIKRQVPSVKFGKLAAYCGSSDIFFGKAQYCFVALFPFVFYCILLIPLCVFLPAMFFPIPFMPLAYNVFGSFADFFMINAALRSARNSVIVDRGTELTVYAPLRREK